MHVLSVAGYLLKHIHTLAYASYSIATPLADNIYIYIILRKKYVLADIEQDSATDL